MREMTTTVLVFMMMMMIIIQEVLIPRHRYIVVLVGEMIVLVRGMLVLVRGILIHSQMNMGRSLKKIQRWKRCQKGVVLVPNLKMILVWNVMLVLVRGKREKKKKKH